MSPLFAHAERRRPRLQRQRHVVLGSEVDAATSRAGDTVPAARLQRPHAVRFVLEAGAQLIDEIRPAPGAGRNVAVQRVVAVEDLGRVVRFQERRRVGEVPDRPQRLLRVREIHRVAARVRPQVELEAELELDGVLLRADAADEVVLAMAAQDVLPAAAVVDLQLQVLLGRGGGRRLHRHDRLLRPLHGGRHRLDLRRGRTDQ